MDFDQVMQGKLNGRIAGLEQEVAALKAIVSELDPLTGSDRVRYPRIYKGVEVGSQAARILTRLQRAVEGEKG